MAATGARTRYADAVTPRAYCKIVFNASAWLTGSGTGCSFTGSGKALVTQSPTGVSLLRMGFGNTGRTVGTMLPTR